MAISSEMAVFRLRARLCVAALLFATALTQPAHAQTFTVLHNFTCRLRFGA